ncbi:hypothetical protein [Embleya sp. NPDC005575]|uniref:hypothetical protein n=1 Tax=Embleya sp. NPDC005575 TaxID=3156892 RepID=UPI0033BC0ED6
MIPRFLRKTRTPNPTQAPDPTGVFEDPYEAQLALWYGTFANAHARLQGFADAPLPADLRRIREITQTRTDTTSTCYHALDAMRSILPEREEAATLNGFSRFCQAYNTQYLALAETSIFLGIAGRTKWDFSDEFAARTAPNWMAYSHGAARTDAIESCVAWRLLEAARDVLPGHRGVMGAVAAMREITIDRAVHAGLSLPAVEGLEAGLMRGTDPVTVGAYLPLEVRMAYLAQSER